MVAKVWTMRNFEKVTLDINLTLLDIHFYANDRQPITHAIRELSK